MHRKRPRVVVSGSSNTDLVIACPRLPAAGETLLGGEFARNAGGKGANQAVAAARAGAEVVFIGAHGPDDFGAQAKSGLEREGIDVSYFFCVPDAPSGVALIPDVEQAGARLRRLGAANAVITLGPDGALLITEDGSQRTPSPKVHPVDTVGAGDCFSAWLTVGIAQGRSMCEAVERAVAAASIAVTRTGAQAAMPAADEVA